MTVGNRCPVIALFRAVWVVISSRIWRRGSSASDSRWSAICGLIEGSIAVVIRLRIQGDKNVLKHSNHIKRSSERLTSSSVLNYCLSPSNSCRYFIFLGRREVEGRRVVRVGCSQPLWCWRHAWKASSSNQRLVSRRSFCHLVILSFVDSLLTFPTQA